MIFKKEKLEKQIEALSKVIIGEKLTDDEEDIIMDLGYTLEQILESMTSDNSI